MTNAMMKIVVKVYEKKRMIFVIEVTIFNGMLIVRANVHNLENSI